VRSILTGSDTLSPVAIYVCGNDAGSALLPKWHDSIWNPTIRHSVPRYFKDNSLGKYIMKPSAFGLNDTLCFTLSGPIGSSYELNQISQYFHDVLPEVDDSVNFADFDNDGPNGIPASQDICCGGGGDDDGVVDGFFFMIVNHVGNAGSSPDPARYNFDYKTHDAALNGDTIEIKTPQVVVVKTNGRERAVALPAHEWGHVLGLTELYGYGWDKVNEWGYWGLGSFSIMGTGFPGLRAVPLDPYSRIQLGWDTSIVINSPVYGQQISDYVKTGTIYKLPVSSTEYFLVTNHKGVDPETDTSGIWEERMPGINGGLMIWHIDETGPLTDFALPHLNLHRYSAYF
jgi:M6 family metalloprotease-like protein